MKNQLGNSQVTMADLMPMTKKLVTCVQYGRHLYVFDPEDSLIRVRLDQLKSIHRAKEAAIGKLPTESQRMQAMLHVSQLKIDVVENVDYARLTSSEIALELMDSLTFVHDYTDGKVCC